MSGFHILDADHDMALAILDTDEDAFRVYAFFLNSCSRALQSVDVVCGFLMEPIHLRG